MTTKRNDKKNDEAIDMTFSASDPTAHGPATGTELPTQPVDRKAPVVTREQIEQAQRGEGHKHQEKDMSTEIADSPSAETEKVRQGTGPRATVSVLLLSLGAAVVAGVVLVGYLTFVN